MCAIKVTVGEEGLLVARHRIQSSKILRVNLSEIYQYLHAESILDEMVKRRLIQSYTDIISYQSNYAKNIAAGLAILSTARKHPLYLLSLCYILKSRGCPQQRYLALKLRSGTFLHNLFSSIYINVFILPTKHNYVGSLTSHFLSRTMHTWT